jgi:ankyrin repeat protein
MAEDIQSDTGASAERAGHAQFNAALSDGIKARDSEMIALALQNGANPNHLLFAGILYRPSVWDQARRRNLDCAEEWVKLALDHGADPNATKMFDDKKPWPAIHWAQRFFDPKITDMLIGAGALVDAKSPLGRTTLMDAVRNGYSNEIEYFLGKGADPLCPCAEGDFPLKHLRASDKFKGEEKTRLVKLMMEHSAANADTPAEAEPSAPRMSFNI